MKTKTPAFPATEADWTPLSPRDGRMNAIIGKALGDYDGLEVLEIINIRHRRIRKDRNYELVHFTCAFVLNPDYRHTGTYGTVFQTGTIQVHVFHKTHLATGAYRVEFDLHMDIAYSKIDNWH
jgi:hypothetical protein